MDSHLSSRGLANLAYRLSNEPGYLETFLKQMEESALQSSTDLKEMELQLLQQLFGPNLAPRLTAFSPYEIPGGSSEEWWY